MNCNWTEKQLAETVLNWNLLTAIQKNELQTFLNTKFTVTQYQQQNRQRISALQNTENNRNILNGAVQSYPRTISGAAISSKAAGLSGYGIVLTAGGEGERLRLSLAGLGYTDQQLHNFTKATFPLPGLPAGFGALQTNLCLIASLSKEINVDLPVIITTGPAGSTTAEYIPEILAKYNNFGVKNLRVICQAERLHLTDTGQIVPDTTVSPLAAITNPDETGGPLMQLRTPDENGKSCLNWFSSLGCHKILVLQATALYNPQMLFAMAAAGKQYDGLGVGIERQIFPHTDPYGTFVQISRDGRQQLIIVEKEIRNATTCQLQNPANAAYLPFNTGFYVFDCALLEQGVLPDYATPPKEMLPGLPKAPKIGYAATDILSLAKSPAVLTVPVEWFAVIKTAEDLHQLADLAVKCGLDEVIKQTVC